MVGPTDGATERRTASANTRELPPVVRPPRGEMAADATRRRGTILLGCLLVILAAVTLAGVGEPATADATDLTADSATDVSIDPDGTTTQTVRFDLTVDGSAATETVTIAPTDLPDGILHDADATVESGGNASVSETTVSAETVTLTLAGTDGAGGTDVSVVTTITYDTAGLTAGDAVADASHRVAAGDGTGGVTDTVSFDLRYETADATRTQGAATVLNGTPVFQGEADLTFLDTDGTRVDAGAFVKTAGQAEGTTLALPIAEDEAVGTYRDPESGMTVTVQEPRITTAEVRRAGSDIGQIPADRAGTLSIVAEWNFAAAEGIAVTVEDPSGSEVTGQVVAGAPTLSTADETLALELAGEDPGVYTVRFEGNRSLDHGAVTETYTIETTEQDSLTLSVASENATRGTRLDYTVAGGLDGNRHLVTIPASSLRAGVDPADLTGVFRNVEDTTTVGLWNATGQTAVTGDEAYDRADIAYAYAVVEVEGSEATGEIQTRYLRDERVDVFVYAPAGAGTYDPPATRQALAPFERDDTEVDVRQGTLELASPTGAYTIGQAVDVRGEATSAESVGIYVRDTGVWRPVSVTGADAPGAQVLSVDSDDTFSETDVAIADATATTMAGSQILAFPGRYDIAVVDMADVDDPGASISTADFRDVSSERYRLVASVGTLEATVQTVNGQVAAADGVVDLNGTAPGQDRVAYAFVDDRGETVVDTVSVNETTSTFEAESIGLAPLEQGRVTAHVVSLGRDGIPGEGASGPIAGDDAAAVADYIAGLEGSGDQVRDRIAANTVDASGSDDQLVTRSFRYDDARLSIERVYPAEAPADGIYPVAIDETVVVEATTTRRPDDSAVSLDVLDEDGETLASSYATEWGTDGRVRFRFAADSIGLGPFALELEDGENRVREEVEIVTERDTRTGYELDDANVTLTTDLAGRDELRLTVDRDGADALAIGGIAPEGTDVEAVSGGGEAQGSGIVWNQPQNETVSFTLLPPETVAPGDTVSFSVVDVGTNQRRSVAIEVVETRVSEDASAENATDPAGEATTENATDGSTQADAEANATVEEDAAVETTGSAAANTTDADGTASDGTAGDGEANATGAQNGSNVSAGAGSNASGAGAAGESVEETTPGFGVGVALGAILLVLFGAVRRRS